LADATPARVARLGHEVAAAERDEPERDERRDDGG
jgi:hypothetical protein